MILKYKVLKKNEVVFIGTPKEIKDKYGIYSSMLYAKAKYGTTYKGYTFQRVLNIEELYEDTKRLLLLYGNTNLKDEPSEIVQMLKEEGIEVIVEHYKPIKKKDALGSHGETFQEDWIITLKEVKQ